MRAVGRMLQWAGLIFLPLGMLMQLSGGVSLGQMLVMMVAGFAAFYLGRMLEGLAGR